jgi:hypothetical protein
MHRLLSFVPLSLSLAATAAAQTEGVDVGVPTDVSADKVLTEKKDKPQGFVPKLNAAATGSYNHSSKVVGQTDGGTLQLGLILTGSANLFLGQHEWENDLKVNEAVTRTPQIPKLVKSADELELKSTYIYRIPSLPWFGPYGRGRFNTQIFKGYEVRPEDVLIARPGQTPELRAAGTSIALTGAFEPIFIRESLGAFANPMSEKYLTASAKLGVGMQHVIVRDGFKVTDDAATEGTIEYGNLEDATQGGGELDLSVKGELTTNVTWEAGAQYFLPFYSTLEDGATGFDALTQEYSAKLSLKLSTWASLDYVLTAKKIPLILDEFQVQNGLLFKAGYDLI